MSYTKTVPTRIYIESASFNGSSTYTADTKNFTVNDVKVGEKVHQWKEKIANGQPAASPYSREAHKLVLGVPRFDKSITHQKGYPQFQVINSFAGYPGARLMPSGRIAHLSEVTTVARSEALSKLYKKLESERSELNSYAALAEIGDVLRQFGRPFGSLVDAFLRHENRLIFERRRLVGSKTWKAEKFAKIAADTWLETTLGLLPLISDAESLAKALGRFEYEQSDNPKLRDRMRTRSKVTHKTVATDRITNMTPMGIGYDTIITTTTEVRAQYVIGLEGEIRADFGSNGRLLELLGLEPRNIPLAIWEFTPWSWLVDYGLNVQNILQAGAVCVDRVKWIVLSETKKTIQSYKSTLGWFGTSTWPLVSLESKPDPQKLRKGNPGQGNFDVIRTTFTRSIPATLGVPPLYFKNPLEDLKKTANLLAIAVSRVPRARQTWLS